MSNAVRKAPPPMMTLAEFLEWPGDGSAKHFELVDGVVRAMSPAAATHGIIQASLAFLIKRCLNERKSDCRVMTEGAVVPALAGRLEFACSRSHGYLRTRRSRANHRARAGSAR